MTPRAQDQIHASARISNHKRPSFWCSVKRQTEAIAAANFELDSNSTPAFALAGNIMGVSSLLPLRFFFVIRGLQVHNLCYAYSCTAYCRVGSPQPIVVAPCTGTPLNVVTHLEEAKQQEPPHPPTEKERSPSRRGSTLSATLPQLLPTLNLHACTQSISRVKDAYYSMFRPNIASLTRLLAPRNVEWQMKEESRAHCENEQQQLKRQPRNRIGPTKSFFGGLERRNEWIMRRRRRKSVSSIGGGTHDDRGDDNVLPSSVWGVVFEDDDAGRGKMVPLRGDPDQERRFHRKRNAYFPSDLADARAARRVSVLFLFNANNQSRDAQPKTSGSVSATNPITTLLLPSMCLFLMWRLLSPPQIKPHDDDKPIPHSFSPRPRVTDTVFGSLFNPTDSEDTHSGAVNSSEFGSSFSSSSAHLYSSFSRHGPLTPRQ
ncbi:hypothetical protein BDP27DRAFT_1359792 [Rhodocollybia butyracea]|uniref:Uncharacterized protein n=1 Tax=Rhodocollybia butyracea TaxID=206335 RepID=A0A9P5Q336_9AGAR|nr:hypothetical protein BDP27DRAFT_1359792 [Rhodocollybia butyracea]